MNNKFVALALALAFLAGCGRGSPTSPTSNTVPSPGTVLTSARNIATEPLPTMRMVDGVAVTVMRVAVATLQGPGEVLYCDIRKDDHVSPWPNAVIVGENGPPMSVGINSTPSSYQSLNGFKPMVLLLTGIKGSVETIDLAYR